MNVSSRNGSVTNRNGDLVQVGYHVAGRIKSLNGRALVFVDLQTNNFSCSRTQLGSKIRADVATQSGIVG